MEQMQSNGGTTTGVTATVPARRKSHSLAFTVGVLVLLFFIVVVIASVLSFSTRGKQLSPEEQKAVILKRIQESNKKPLTAEEKTEIYNWIKSGGSTLQFSSSEQSQLSGALNR